MASSSGSLHEDPTLMSPATVDRHRAIVSLMEELEAIDWYDQRIDAAGEESLREILRHNRDEEKEHACMLLEWLRRRDPALDEQLRTYLFREGAITELEEVEEGLDEELAGLGSTGLGIGSLKGSRSL